MSKHLFNTKEDRDTAISKFIDLQNNPGWQLLIEILDANIQVIQEAILDGVENETKETIDRLRDRLKTYRNLRETPQKMIEGLSTEEEFKPELDPFERVEDRKQTT
jgi:hypothetical protein